VPSFTRADWEALRARYRDVLVRRKGAREEHDNATAERLSAEMEQVRDEYFTALPTVEMSCCPFDGQPLRRTFDPHGAEGFWWALAVRVVAILGRVNIFECCAGRSTIRVIRSERPTGRTRCIPGRRLRTSFRASLVCPE
jgi:hypothetical protein